MANSTAGKTDPAPGAGRITGVGGIFFKSKDPKALAAWYRDVLGIAVEDWGGAALSTDAPGHPPVVVWSPFAENTDYFAPSAQALHDQFRGRRYGRVSRALEEKGVKVLKRDDNDPNGKFAWIMDPEGNKIELWQPKKKAARGISQRRIQDLHFRPLGQ